MTIGELRKRLLDFDDDRDVVVGYETFCVADISQIGEANNVTDSQGRPVIVLDSEHRRF